MRCSNITANEQYMPMFSILNTPSILRAVWIWGGWAQSPVFCWLFLGRFVLVMFLMLVASNGGISDPFLGRFLLWNPTFCTNFSLSTKLRICTQLTQPFYNFTNRVFSREFKVPTPPMPPVLENTVAVFFGGWTINTPFSLFPSPQN